MVFRELDLNGYGLQGVFPLYAVTTLAYLRKLDIGNNPLLDGVIDDAALRTLSSLRFAISSVGMRSFSFYYYRAHVINIPCLCNVTVFCF